MTTRRPVLAGLALAMLGGPAFAKGIAMEEEFPPFGMIGKIKAVAGKRDALVEILGSGSGDMPGCLAYLIAEDKEDSDAIWITEIWKDKESHAASLALPAVKEAIRIGRPLITGFELSAETRPLPGASFVKQ